MNCARRGCLYVSSLHETLLKNNIYLVMYLKSHVYGVSAGAQVLSGDHIYNIIDIPPFSFGIL